MIFQCDVAPVQPRDVGVGVGISRLHLRVDIRLLPVDVPPHHVWIRGEPGQTIRDCQPSSAGSGPLLWGRPAGQGSDRQREGAHPPRPQQAEGQAGRGQREKRPSWASTGRSQHETDGRLLD